MPPVALLRLSLFWIACLLLAFAPGRACGIVAAGAPESKVAPDPAAAGLLRGWLAASGQPAPGTTQSATTSTATLADWRRYGETLRERDPLQREQQLRRLYKQTDSKLLQSVILRAISEDPTFRSKQALFIRRYGFYANWFNRLMFSTVRVVQGNVQAFLQLFVDGANDLFHPGEADPLERRALDMMRRADTTPGARGASPAKLNKLQRAVDRALAEADLNQAQWALQAGDPDTALFYAHQAVALQPEWNQAARLERKADDEAARGRREGLASAQVGYPDRTPPVDPADPELVRRLLLGGPALAKVRPQPREQMVIDAIAGLPQPDQGRATMMRPWENLLKADRNAPPDHRRWLSAMVLDPGTNLDQRLSEARSRRRGQLTRYIFVGPERPRERIYKTASWLSSTWDALQNVGIFYVFDVLGRAGQAAFVPPAPTEEVLDAEALWLRNVPDPQSAQARQVGEDLAQTYLRAKRFEDARNTLKRIGLMDPKRDAKINRTEARHLLTLAKSTPEGPDRKALIAKAVALAPNTRLAKNAEKLAKPDKHKEPPQRLQLDWPLLVQWTRQPVPCGLPGRPEWFDGQTNNGEIARGGLVFERKNNQAPIAVQYRVVYPQKTDTFRTELAPSALPPAIRRWFELADSLRAQAAQTIKQLNRLPVPFAVEGGAGLSGVDLYPKLLPMQTKPGEIDLYR